MIGLIASFLIVFGIEFIDKVLKIDDPVGAIGVHGLCGATGTILVGLFAVDGGLLYGGGAKMLGVQVLGVLSVAAWVVVTMTIVFFLIKKTIGLRVTKEEEITGLDISEHGLESSYANFVMIDHVIDSETVPAIVGQGAIPADRAIPVKVVSSPNPVASDVKITKIEILMKQIRFEALKEAMNRIGVTGMTVTQVLGYGIQRGRTEHYRGVEVEVNLLPKIKVEIVVSKVPVKTVVETAKSVLYTGNIGDGKIFIYDTENVIKVRTGEEGYEALQDE